MTHSQLTTDNRQLIRQMLKNYIKIAIRNLRRNKIYSTISVLGLAIGITGATLLYLYINDELSYDNFHEKSNQIYRVVEISPDGYGKVNEFMSVIMFSPIRSFFRYLILSL